MYQMVPVGDSPPLMPTHREHYNAAGGAYEHGILEPGDEEVRISPKLVHKHISSNLPALSRDWEDWAVQVQRNPDEPPPSHHVHNPDFRRLLNAVRSGIQVSQSPRRRKAGDDGYNAGNEEALQASPQKPSSKEGSLRTLQNGGPVQDIILPQPTNITEETQLNREKELLRGEKGEKSKGGRYVPGVWKKARGSLFTDPTLASDGGGLIGAPTTSHERLARARNHQKQEVFLSELDDQLVDSDARKKRRKERKVWEQRNFDHRGGYAHASPSSSPDPMLRTREKARRPQRRADEAALYTPPPYSDRDRDRRTPRGREDEIRRLEALLRRRTSPRSPRSPETMRMRKKSPRRIEEFDELGLGRRSP